MTVADALPASFTATAMSGSGWDLHGRNRDVHDRECLAAGASYPPITLTVDVAADAPPFPTNTVTVSGGNEASM